MSKDLQMKMNLLIHSSEMIECYSSDLDLLAIREQTISSLCSLLYQDFLFLKEGFEKIGVNKENIEMHCSYLQVFKGLFGYTLFLDDKLNLNEIATELKRFDIL
ncbi:hypothetical protein [Segetibacter aerophilus]|nr:hypothetical protein [Segetibacter aerophilus]